MLLRPLSILAGPLLHFPTDVLVIVPTVIFSHEENVKPPQAEAAMDMDRRQSSHGPNWIFKGKLGLPEDGGAGDTAHRKKMLTCAHVATHLVVYSS